MGTGTRARSYGEMVSALATEGLPALQDGLAGLASEDWERPTLLRTTRRRTAALDGPAAGRPLRRLHGPDHGPGGRANLGPAGGGPGQLLHSVSDRSTVSPVIYQYIVDHAQGHTPATIVDKVGVTFAKPWRRSGPRPRHHRARLWADAAGRVRGHLPRGGAGPRHAWT